MYNQNPNQASPQKAWNENVEPATLGFAKRDARTTNAISTPMVIPKLGQSYQTYMAHYPTPIVGVSRRPFATWENQEEASYTIPGIMTLDFEPLIAHSEPIAQSEVADIFTNIWTQMRILNNMTRDFQPQDIQIVFAGLMEIKTHMANVRRILNLMKSCLNHELNDYYFSEPLVKALGFPMTETEMRQHWEEWWQMYNVTLVGNLSKIRWFTDALVPGQNRWAGLCSQIYKDTPAYTDYCQVYMLRPRYFHNIVARWDESSRAYLWTFSHEGYMVDDLPSSTGVNAFTLYLERIHTLIRDIFYDDSTATIIATINAIVERNMGDQIHAEFLQFPNIPWEGEPTPLTFDMNMMLAIHNATILPVTVHDPIQDVESGRLEQTVTAQPTTYDKAAMAMAFPKVVNMPNYGLTTDDFICATQWTVTNTPYGLATEVIYMRPGSMGTEVLTRAKIWRNQFNQVTGTYVLSSLAFDSVEVPYYSGGDPTANELRGIINRMNALTAFENAPMQYILDYSHATDQQPGAVKYVTGQAEVMYVGDFGVLSQMHKQFVRNFWGYPFETPESEQFHTSWKDGSRK